MACMALWATVFMFWQQVRLSSCLEPNGESWMLHRLPISAPAVTAHQLAKLPGPLMQFCVGWWMAGTAFVMLYSLHGPDTGLFIIGLETLAGTIFQTTLVAGLAILLALLMSPKTGYWISLFGTLALFYGMPWILDPNRLSQAVQHGIEQSLMHFTPSGWLITWENAALRGETETWLWMIGVFFVCLFVVKLGLPGLRRQMNTDLVFRNRTGEENLHHETTGRMVWFGTTAIDTSSWTHEFKFKRTSKPPATSAAPADEITRESLRRRLRNLRTTPSFSLRTRGTLERFAYSLLSPRRQKTVDFLQPLPERNPTRRSWLTIWGGTLLMQMLAFVTMHYGEEHIIRWTIGVMLAAGSLFWLLPVAGGVWKGLGRAPRQSQSTALLGYHPISIQTSVTTALLINLIRTLLSLPLIATVCVLPFWNSSLGMFYPLILAFSILLILQPIGILLQLTPLTNDWSARPWMRIVTPTIGIILPVAFILKVPDFISEKYITTILFVYMGMTWSMLAGYLWLWNQRLFDLVSNLPLHKQV